MARRVAGARPGWWTALAGSIAAFLAIEAIHAYARIAVLESKVERHQQPSEAKLDSLLEKIHARCDCKD